MYELRWIIPLKSMKPCLSDSRSLIQYLLGLSLLFNALWLASTTWSNYNMNLILNWYIVFLLKKLVWILEVPNDIFPIYLDCCATAWIREFFEYNFLLLNVVFSWIWLFTPFPSLVSQRCSQNDWRCGYIDQIYNYYNCTG